MLLSPSGGEKKLRKRKQIRITSCSRELNFTLEQHGLQWNKCSLEEDSGGSREKDASVQIRERKQASIKDETEIM